MNLKEWKKTTLKNYIEKHSPSKAEVDHVVDYLQRHPQRLGRLSYPQAYTKAENWTRALNKKNKNLKDSGEVEVVYSWPEAKLTMVRLKDQTAKDWEGKHMSHCVASYKDHKGIYSLRDEDDLPHATLEVKRGEVEQIQGKGNKELVDKYIPYVFALIRAKKWTISNHYASRLGLKKLYKNSALALNYYFKGVELISNEHWDYMWAKIGKLKAKREEIFNLHFLKKTLLWTRKIELDFNETSEVSEILVLSGQPEILEFVAENFATKGLGNWSHAHRQVPVVFHATLEKLVKERDFKKLDRFITLMKISQDLLNPILMQAIIEEDKECIEFCKDRGVRILEHSYYRCAYRAKIAHKHEEILRLHKFSQSQIDVLLSLKDSPELFRMLLSRFIHSGDKKNLESFRDVLYNSPELRTSVIKQWVSESNNHLKFCSQELMDVLYPLMRSVVGFEDVWRHLDKQTVIHLVETNLDFRTLFFKNKCYNYLSTSEQIRLASKISYPKKQLNYLIDSCVALGNIELMKQLKELGAEVSKDTLLTFEAYATRSQEILKIIKS